MMITSSYFNTIPSEKLEITYISLAKPEVGNLWLWSRMWLFCLPSAALLLFFEASECEMILRSMPLTTGEDLFFFFFLENTYDLCSVELFWLSSVSLLW